ncbi:MAG: diacylglycerol kinase family protein [Coriobacteriales bacterium]|jgi:diacylglycerol kinase (ATP)
MADEKLHHQSQAHSFAVAFTGIGRTFKNELHMKIHLCFAIAALVACAALGVDAIGWCLVILCIGMVFAAELVNTALEALCDKVSPEIDPRIKVCKDAAAGAVLVLAICSVIVGLIVYIPPFLRLIGA